MTAPAPQPEFSNSAIAQLSHALQLYVTSWDKARQETLHRSLEHLCSEAHIAKVGPERVVATVKEVWTRIPGIDRVNAERARIALQQVIGHCIAVYYGETPSSPRD